MAETLLITGANGYVALHLIKQALSQGFRVIGTVRSSSSAEKVLAAFPTASSHLSLVQVPDITKAESFEKAFSNFTVSSIINLASPLINNPKDVRSDILDPAIQSGVAILEAAVHYGGPAFKRVVHVGSFASSLDLSLGNAPGKTYTPDDWNPLTYEEAADGGQMTAYMGSKTLAEKSMWDWMRDHKPAFDLVAINPSAIFGPHLGPINLDHLNVSTQMLWELVAPSPNPPPYNSYHLGTWVDVRDVSTALLAAVKVPAAGGERFLASQRCHWQLVRDEARRVLPELESRIGEGEPGAWRAARDTTYNVDGSKLERILGVSYTSLEVCLKDSYSQLLDAEKYKGVVPK
ncbi:hypothetical protein B7463_g8234, partial [Scytalidium lignicola]